MYRVGRTNDLLKVKPIYTEKVRIAKLESIKQVGDGKKYVHVQVEDKCGRLFGLYRRVSQEKFPNISKDSVVTIGFSGSHVSGIPKFPILIEVHHKSQWKDVVSYYMDTKSPLGKQANCEGCGSALHE